MISAAQAPEPGAASEPLPTPDTRTLYATPRDGLPLLLQARETYENCGSYHAQGAVRVVLYEESNKTGGFLFQGERSATRTKRYKLFDTSFKRHPFALRHEIVSIGPGRSFTSVEFWSAQRHASDHYSSSNLPMSSEALASSIRENNFLLVNYDPAPEWLLASNDELADALPPESDWLMDNRRLPRDVWWIGEENLAGVPTDILVWKADDVDVALWVTRTPVSIVKVMAERREQDEFMNVTALIQPEFGKIIGNEFLTLNRPRPDFFDINPETVVFGSLDMPPVPDEDAERTGAALTQEEKSVRRTVTPNPEPEPEPEAETEPEKVKPQAGVSNATSAPMDFGQLPGGAVEEEAAAAAETQSKLTPEQMAALVIIEGDAGVGTGFFCHVRGRDFIVTNLHTLSGHRSMRIRTVNGNPVQPKEIYGAVGHDIALIAVDQTWGELKAASNVAEETQLGAPVVVPGNKLGGGVMTEVEGKVLGIGPDRVQVAARFEPGNSGSPIINQETGKVIGVATYITGDMPENFVEEAAFEGGPSNSANKIRWFGYRIDSVEKWDLINWHRWQRQYDQIQQFNDDSLAIYNFITNRKEFYNNDNMRALYDDYIVAMNKADKSGGSYHERETKLFIQRIINLANRDVDIFRKTDFYDYFKSTAGPEDNVTTSMDYRELLLTHLNRLLTDDWSDIMRRVKPRG